MYSSAIQAKTAQVAKIARRQFWHVQKRWDPNAAWSVETSMRIARRLDQEGIDWGFLEDPTAGLEGMSE